MVWWPATDDKFEQIKKIKLDQKLSLKSVSPATSFANLTVSSDVSEEMESWITEALETIGTHLVILDKLVQAQIWSSKFMNAVSGYSWTLKRSFEQQN